MLLLSCTTTLCDVSHLFHVGIVICDCTGILDRLDILVILDISGLTFPLPAPPSLLFPCHHDLKDKLSQSHLHCSASAMLRREISLCTCWISPCWFPSRTGTLWRNRQLSLGMFLFLTLTLLPVLTRAPLPPTVLSHLSLLHFSCTQQSPLAQFPLLERKQILDITFPTSTHLTFLELC